jgi:cell division protein FtsL
MRAEDLVAPPPEKKDRGGDAGDSKKASNDSPKATKDTGKAKQPDKPKNKDKGISTVEIVLITIAGVVIICAVSVLVFAFYFNHKKRKDNLKKLDDDPDAGQTALLGMESIA